MKLTAKNNDKAIITLLNKLEQNLNIEELIIKDNWKSDRCAIGLRSNIASSNLVYISTYEKPEGVYYYELEIENNKESIYDNIQEGEVHFNELVKIIKSHLNLN